MIRYDEKEKVFHLHSCGMSYHMEVDGILKNLYFGKSVEDEDVYLLKEDDFHSSFDQHTDLEREEYTCFNGHSYSLPCLKSNAGEIRALNMGMDRYEIVRNEEQEELSIYLLDQNHLLNVTLIYILYSDAPIIERKTVIQAERELELTSAYSAAMSIPKGRDVTLHYLSGKWAGEWQMETMPITTGVHMLQSKRGITGPHFNPSAALAETGATETSGEVWFTLLGYSGNWAFHIEKTIFGNTRVTAGINDCDFSWPMKRGDIFQTPSVYLGYTDGGFGEMSRILHQFENQYILPERPLRKVMYNSWEATAFQVQADSQKLLAKQAAKMGCEVFVVDDGWFGERNNDQAGLGDWNVNPGKFPDGLQDLIHFVNDLGMEFGIWVEPEAVNPDSNLFRQHPEWIYSQPGIEPITARNQLVLNITLPEVRDYIKKWMTDLLRNNHISFLKWDMNRHISDLGSSDGSRPGTLWHRHVLALYEIWSYLKQEFPQVEIETCAGGGGRIDLGILKYADQCWPSDNTDPYDRLLIQEGFTRFYPPSIMMSWVTDSGKSRRKDALSLKYRFYSAMCGCLSIGADISKFTEEEIEACGEYIKQYKAWRHIIQRGKLYRLMSPVHHKQSAVEYVEEDGREGVVFVFHHGGNYGDKSGRVRLQGLAQNAWYMVFADGSFKKVSGAYLCNIGLKTSLTDDYDCVVYYLKKCEC